jgi:hypothetical protein
MIATDDEQAPSIRYGEKVALVRQAIEVDLIGHADRQIVVGLDQTEPLRSQPRLYRTTVTKRRRMDGVPALTSTSTSSPSSTRVLGPAAEDSSTPRAPNDELPNMAER